MLAYTAVDGLEAIKRIFGVGSARLAGDRLELALHSQRPISASALRVLFARAGRSLPASDAALAAVLAAGPAVGAWEGQRLVGFARALTDRYLVAHIEDLLVDRHYRDQGLGRALTTRLLAELKDVEVVSIR